MATTLITINYPLSPRNSDGTLTVSNRELFRAAASWRDMVVADFGGDVTLSTIGNRMVLAAAVPTTIESYGLLAALADQTARSGGMTSMVALD